jgi:hypothetical protein
MCKPLQLKQDKFVVNGFSKRSVFLLPAKRKLKARFSALALTLRSASRVPLLEEELLMKSFGNM